MPNQAFVAALQAQLANLNHDDEARARLLPTFDNGNPSRNLLPPANIQPRHGAVLALLYPEAENLFVPLTVRSGNLRSHTGEISLPGGSIDSSDASPEAAALREAHEEIGLHIDQPTIIGRLSELYVPVSNFLITPIVAWLDHAPDLAPNPSEVAAVLHLPLHHLWAADAVQTEERMIRGVALQVPHYPYGEHKIWGATSIILTQLALRAQAALQQIV
ncbi:NUDIX hydrolase [Herpetosiphon giganteus]|uniref:NUDIX hydrolase n=1 Tax=Herpetosiphon giganteus TaxID=2029754 RepID=UPI0019564471|nr:CoA pyrophosphatase [Herpetosiphon giganteus]MBM7843605.1 8-oxo-dGTP pyrophosphatase MutT (NUDIX family) [Herpetosiphon giganteus]